MTLAVSALALLAGTVIAADRDTPVDRPVAEAFPEVAVGGLTAQEIIVRRDNLHTWLLTELPDGTLDNARQIQLSDVELANLASPQLDDVGRLQVGFVKPMAAPVKVANLSRKLLKARASRGSNVTLHATDDGGFVWATAIQATGADGMRLHFTNFSIPDDADLYVLSPVGDAYEPYQRRGPNDDGDFWSHTVMSDTAIVLVRHFGPAGTEELGQLSFTISEVGLVGRGLNRTGDGGVASFCSYNVPCIENTNCSGGPAWSAKSDAENATAMMLWISGAFIYTCSGGLLADSDSGTQIPYFLTANHCISKSGDAANLETYWQYQTPCNGSCPPAWTGGGMQLSGGAQIMSSNRRGDYTLLRLNNSPPSGSVFMGWTSAPVANSNGTALFRISHPATAPQAYSAQTVDTSAGTCRGWPRGERIYSRDTYGGTEGGSSGSPVYNASGQVVGQLSGACGTNVGDACDSNSNATVDGAFAYYFADVEPFLGSGGVGGCTGDAECDDGLFCTGTETCVSGTCQSSGNPCAASETCDEGTDTCVVCTLKQQGESCTDDAECCSNKCKGPPSGKTCR